MTLTTSELRARLEAAVAVDAPERPATMTVRTLHELYLAHATKRYGGRHGRKAINAIRQSFEPFLLMYADVDPDKLRPLQLRAARQFWIERGIVRTTIQSRLGIVRQAWRWGMSVELIRVHLPEIEKIRFGEAKDAERTTPVDLEIVQATIAAARPQMALMLNLLLLTGMRPGELCDMRGVDIETRSSPWVYRPWLHKGSWQGKVREIYIGPRAQALLTESGTLKPGWMFLTRLKRKWTPACLYNAVRKICVLHKIPHWHPYQLRHTAGTIIRRECGLEAVQAVLGHSLIETSQIYAEKSAAHAIEAIRKLG